MTLPNKITIIRILLVPFFILSIINYAPERSYLRFVALGIFSVAALTDFLDGYIARKFKQKTEAGRILDVAADKILLISAYLLLAIYSNLPLRLPLWVAFVIIGRDIIIILGVILLYIMYKRLYILPSPFLGKISIAFEMFTIISVLLLFKYSYIIWNLTVILTVFSGLGYLISATNLIRKEKRV